jgi:predicted nuclease of predicted toxin-antitoxin system
VKRILFDENMPRKLRRELPQFIVRTVQEEGWAGFENGNLLRRASATFDVLLTADQRLRYQQNVAQFEIGVVVIETVDTTLGNLRRFLPKIHAAIESVSPGTVVIVRSELHP